MLSLTVSCALLLAVPLPPQLPARLGDWPGWRGPSRDNISQETGLLKVWPNEGPKLLWKTTGLGSGYSTPSVANGLIYLLGATDGVENLIALNRDNGEKVWSTPFGKTAGGYPGPRSTPTIDGNTLYVISSNGILLCADAKTGAEKWKKDFKADFGGQAGGWAYTESPLIDGDKLLCTPGGKTPIVALDKKTGSMIWRADFSLIAEEAKNKPAEKPNEDPKAKKKAKGFSQAAGYSSIVVADYGGRQYVQFLSGGVVGVDAGTGKLLWHYDHPANGTANISTPIVLDDAVFAASAYGVGGGLAHIRKSGSKYTAEEAYFLSDMQNHHGGMVQLAGHLYGTNGSSLLCIRLADGNIVWKNKSVGKGSVAYADGHLYVRSEGGPVALVEVNPEKYVETGRFNQPDRAKERAWAHPVIAGGTLLLRDQDVILCYDVKKRD
jgi:outer membrane protein assembly factor BamB